MRTGRNQCIIIALDMIDMGALFQLVDQLDARECRLKVGKELFTRYGPLLVRQLSDRGFEIFLDLKFHDIPNTVAHAVAAAAELGVWMVNVHACGGVKMLEAAKKALESFGNDAPQLIAVTLLTSLEAHDLPPVGVADTPLQQVERLALLAKSCGLNGVVCSAQEASRLRTLCGSPFSLVTPGIRPEGSIGGDQRRIMTPAQAVAGGADYLVIGRPITQASEPLLALQTIQHSLGSAMHLCIEEMK